MTGLIIAITLGWAGGYQFYKHKTGMGILYLLTGGLFCIGWVMDILAAYKEYKNPDSAGSVDSAVYPSESKHSEEYYDYESKYMDSGIFDKWQNKIDNIDDFQEDPDEVVRAYKRKIEIAKEFEEFSKTKPYGYEFYKEYYNAVKVCTEELQDYLNNEYENAKKEYLEEKKEDEEYQNTINALCDKITDLIKNGTTKQTEIKDSLSGSDIEYYNFAINRLLENNIISRKHEKGRVIFSLITKEI